MILVRRTDSDDPDFIELVKQLDADLALRDGNEHSFYHQFNKIDSIKYAVVVYDHDLPVGCGAIKPYEDKMEVKRMYVVPQMRRKGIAGKILSGLEQWVVELSYSSCVLETGKKQPEAIRLYQRNGYVITGNYGQYRDVENSICFEKKLVGKV